MYYVYISDTKSVSKMENFWNLDLKCQIKKEDKSEWIGGEYYIQTSLYNYIKNNENFKIICIDKSYNNKIFEDAKIILVPGWTSLPAEYNKYINKIYSYSYFENMSKINIILNPFKYNKLNLFLPVTPIELPINKISNIKFNDYNINGLLVGKCISHIISKKKDNKLIEILNSLKYKIFSTMRELHNFKNMPNYLINNKDKYIELNKIICNHDKLNNLGILNPLDFRFLLKHCKYVIFIHGAFSPPTIIEALFEKCIILATQDVIPADLLNNKNIYLFDNKCLYEINELIENIENNIICFDIDEFPIDYLPENKLKFLEYL